MVAILSRGRLVKPQYVNNYFHSLEQHNFWSELIFHP